MDKIQAEFAVFESITGLRNWLPHIFSMRVLDVEQKIGCAGLVPSGAPVLPPNGTGWSWSPTLDQLQLVRSHIEEWASSKNEENKKCCRSNA
jgi:hypothetical protein